MKSHRIYVICACLALTFGLVGCGGGGDSATSENKAPAEAAVVANKDDRSMSPPAPLVVQRTAKDFAADPADAQAPQVKAQAISYAADITASMRTIASAHLSAVVAPVQDATAFNVYVSTAGNDAWSGLLASANGAATDGPVKTIAAAQSIARQQLARMNAGTASRVAVKVLIAAGDYYLQTPLQFTPADSGTAAAPVAYAAISPGTVNISGGVQLAQQTTAGAANASFASPVAGGNQWAGGGQLFVNDTRATLARQPNAGSYWFVKKQVSLPTEAVGAQGFEAFGMFADAQSWVSTLSAGDRSRAIVNVMHSWTSAQGRFSGATAPADTLALQPRALWPYLNFGTSQRYYVENVAAAFDAPGEWLWDASGVKYIPLSGETAASATAVMPILERLVTVTGNIAGNQLVEYLQFSGLTFKHTRSLISAQGFNDNQAATEVSAAIEVDGARAILIDNCTVKNAGGYGVWFRRAVRDSKLTNSTLTDLGAGGVKMGQTYQAVSDVVQTGNNEASGNRVSETGKVYPGGVGIWVGQGYDNVVANNAVFNTTYSGISVGWSWGYVTAKSGRNVIKNNLLYSIGQAVLDDLGAIYSVGISQDTVIQNNVIREVRGYPGYGVGAWGIYTDAGSSGMLIQRNIVVGTDNGGYHLNFGRKNTVFGNVFAQGKKSEFIITTTDPAETKLAVTGNVIVPLFATPFINFAQAPDAIFSYNSVSPLLVGSSVLDITKCGAGCARQAFNVATTDSPRGISMVGTSPGFTALVADIVAAAGPYVAPTAPPVVEPPVVPPPPPPAAPPISFDTNFATSTIGTQPVGLQYFPPADLTAMKLVSDVSAPGGRCMQFNDSPSMPQRYFPFLYATLNHDAGTTIASFSIKIDANSNFYHEWRDDNRPDYLVGPSLRIGVGGVTVAGKVVAAAAAGEWLKLKITAPLATANGTWSLEVQRANGTITTVNNLAFGSPGWKRLNWLGFVSDAETTSTMCLSNVNAASSVQ